MEAVTPFNATSAAASAALPESSDPSWRQHLALSPGLFVALFSMIMTLVYNQAFWKVFLDNSSSIIFAIAGALFISFWFIFFFNFVAFRPILKPALGLVLLVASLSSYFQNNYGTIIDASMIHNVLETDPHEATELISGPFLMYMGGYFLLPLLVLTVLPLRWSRRHQHWFHRVGYLLLSVTMLAGLFVAFNKDFSFLFRQNPVLRSLINPTYPIHSMIKAVREKVADPVTLTPIGEDARQTATQLSHEQKTVFVFVVGETARAANFSLNGYSRNTNPELAEAGVINFPAVTSCGTSTAESLPCMFSHLSKSDYSRSKAYQFENLLDVLDHAGVPSVWIDNQSGCKGLCDRTQFISTTGYQDATLCTEGECRDEIMLGELEKRLADPAYHDKDQLIVMHQEGSHGPAYYKRVPDAWRVFTPECHSVNLQECTREQVINSYDNTILYTDHFLAEVIKTLKGHEDDYRIVMVYVSDHGESLGEKGLYLHGMPYLFAPDEQTHVPSVLWASNGFQTSAGLDQRCLAARAGKPQSHDNIFHSVLGALGIETTLYQPELDLLRSCGGRDET